MPRTTAFLFAAVLTGLFAFPAAEKAVAAGLRVAVPALPQSLVNPFRTVAPPSIYVTTAVFDTLTRFDHEGRLQPWLALRWSQAGPQAWDFWLREGVRFSNGEPFDATAVAASVAFLASQDSLMEGVRREVDFLAEAEILGPHQIRIHTRVPVPLLPRFMAAMPIIAPDYWARTTAAEYARAPVGTGPFMLEAWTTSGIRFRAFRESWRAPRVESLEFITVPNPTARLSGLLSDVFDIAIDIAPDDLHLLEEAGDIPLARKSYSVTGLSFFLARSGPFDDVRVRRAVNMAVNRAAIISTLLAESATPSGQPASQQALGFDPQVAAYPYDPETARALLAEAGYPAGFTFTLETNVGYSPGDTAIYQQIAQDLSAVGVEMKISVLPTPEFLTKRGSGRIDGDAFSAEWPAWPTLDALRAVLPHSCLRRPVAWYCDEAAMPLIQQALVESDPGKAVGIRQQLMRRYHEMAPALFLYEAPEFLGLRREVEHFRQDVNHINYHEISVRD